MHFDYIFWFLSVDCVIEMKAITKGPGVRTKDKDKGHEGVAERRRWVVVVKVPGPKRHTPNRESCSQRERIKKKKKRKGKRKKEMRITIV